MVEIFIQGVTRATVGLHMEMVTVQADGWGRMNRMGEEDMGSLSFSFRSLFLCQVMDRAVGRRMMVRPKHIQTLSTGHLSGCTHRERERQTPTRPFYTPSRNRQTVYTEKCSKGNFLLKINLRTFCHTQHDSSDPYSQSYCNSLV